VHRRPNREEEVDMAEMTGMASGIASLFNTPTTQSTSKGDKLDRDSFLTLLTTQLQNQNPLEPASNEEFIAQLTTFSSLEQLQSINTNLESVYYGIAAMNSASMASLLGTDIVAVGDEFSYDGTEDVALDFTVPMDSSATRMSIYDENNRLVAEKDLGAFTAGDATYTWDGKGLDGKAVPEGLYHYTVTGTDVDGGSIDVEEHIHGMVTEMDYSTGSPLPSVGGAVVALENIIRLTTGSDS
jgi:flagellar basal-body rod modification protein FlgD